VLDQISSPASPMGGGSASALTGALGSALGYMVARLSKLECDHFLGHREFFAHAVERDAAAFNQVQMAGKAGESVRQAELQKAYCVAATVPVEISERARALDRHLLELKDTSLAKLKSDVITGLALARASRAGGIAAARSNLPFIEDPAQVIAAGATIRVANG